MIKIQKYEFDHEVLRDIPVGAPEWVKPDFSKQPKKAGERKIPMIDKVCIACGVDFKSRKDKESQVRCAGCQEVRNRLLGRASYQRLKGK